MKNIKPRSWVAALLSVFLMSCLRPGPPTTDSTPPDLTLTAFNRSGNPTFNSSEGTDLSDACAKFRALPASFFLSVNDTGGVRLVGVKLFPGRFVRDSISVGPAGPESSWEISPTPGGEQLLVRLTPPPDMPDMVRTGVGVLFEADGDTAPVSVLADALDYNGNRGELDQIDARLTNDLVVCRGE